MRRDAARPSEKKSSRESSYGRADEGRGAAASAQRNDGGSCGREGEGEVERKKKSGVMPGEHRTRAGSASVAGPVRHPKAAALLQPCAQPPRGRDRVRVHRGGGQRGGKRAVGGGQQQSARGGRNGSHLSLFPFPTPRRESARVRCGAEAATRGLAQPNDKGESAGFGRRDSGVKTGVVSWEK